MRVVGEALQNWWEDQAALQVLAPGGFWAEEAPGEAIFPVVIFDISDPVIAFNSLAKFAEISISLEIYGVSSDSVEVVANEIAAQLERATLVFGGGWLLCRFDVGEPSATKLQTERDIWSSVIKVTLKIQRTRTEGDNG